MDWSEKTVSTVSTRQSWFIRDWWKNINFISFEYQLIERSFFLRQSDVSDSFFDHQFEIETKRRWNEISNEVEGRTNFAFRSSTFRRQLSRWAASRAYRAPNRFLLPFQFIGWYFYDRFWFVHGNSSHLLRSYTAATSVQVEYSINGIRCEEFLRTWLVHRFRCYLCTTQWMCIFHSFDNSMNKPNSWNHSGIGWRFCVKNEYYELSKTRLNNSQKCCLIINLWNIQIFWTWIKSNPTFHSKDELERREMKWREINKTKVL